MARILTNNNPLLQGIRGRIGNFVIRQTKTGPVICKLPDYSNYKQTPQQKQHTEKFARAVAYARGINNDPILRERWKSVLKKGETVYHAALKEYLRKHKQDAEEQS